MGMIKDILGDVFGVSSNEKDGVKTSNFNKSIDNKEYYDTIDLIDASTGSIVKSTSIQDSIRLARSGQNVSDNVYVGDNIVHSKNINGNIISDLLYNDKDSMSPTDCVASVGSYITGYVNNKISTLGDKNSNLGMIPNGSGILDDLTFRNYLSTSGEETNIATGEAANDAGTTQEQISRKNAGIGLGQCTVLNPPFQFNKRDDPRTNPVYTKIGRVYSTQVMNNWPVVLIQPGRFKYNTSFMKLLGFGGGASINETLIRTGGEGLSGAIAKFFGCISDTFSIVGTIGSGIFGGNRAVEFRQAINLYKIYVRFLWTNLAGDMGLINGSKYAGSVKNLNLNSILPSNFLIPGSYIGNGDITHYLNDQYLPFRCGKGVTTSETFSNSMSSNPLMEKLNDMSNENNEAATGDAGTKTLLGDAGGAVKSGAMKLASNFSEMASVASGRGKISLPDVFTSSSFSRSFSFDFKFHSPYGDPLSVFENEYIQYMTLLALTAPRQTGKLSYTSPFAVRIMVKNRIMINFGMVESLTIARGGDSNDWTPSGYPKTLSCSLSIKDMEPNISLPMASRGPLKSALEVMFPSTGISEYLASLGGLSFHDLNAISRGRRAAQMFTSSWNAKLDLDNMFSSVVNCRPIANIFALTATTNLDRYASLGDTMAQNIKANSMTVINKIVMPSFVAHSVGENGADAVTTYKTDAAGISSAMNNIGKEISGNSVYDAKI